MKSKLLISLFLAILSLMCLTGCSKDGNQVIARVNGDKITTQEFNDYFNRMRMAFPTAQDEYNKRRELLDTLAVSRLLVQAAYEKNIDKLEEIARIVAANKDRFLLDVLYDRHIASKAKPTEAELKEYYNKLEFKLRIWHILIDNPDTANMLVEKIANGADFAQLAFDYSKDPQARKNRGDLGYLLWGSLVDEFQEAAFQMEPGQVSPPVKSRFGYHVIKVVDKLPNEQRGEYEDMLDILKSQVSNRKSFRLAEAYFDSVRKKYPITIDTATCQYIIHKREAVYPPQVLASLPKNDFDAEQLDRDERELVLAVFEGGQVTLNQYLTQIKDVPEQVRPDFDDYDSLQTIVFELKRIDLLQLEAIREGIDKDGGYLEKINLFKELNMADIMRNDSIPMPPEPDEGTLRQYYDEHPEEFTNPAQVHVFEILLSDELKARKLAKDIKSLKQFKERAMDLTERPGRRAQSGDLGFIQRAWYPEVFDLAMKTSVGAIGGPVVTGGKYSIFYVADRIEAQLKDFLGQKRIIYDKIRRQQRDLAFQSWVDERIKASTIEIDEQALWKTVDAAKYAQADTTAGA